MKLISKKQDLIDNIITLENYLNKGNDAEREFAKELMQKGKTICIYKVNGENHFAPSRFLGYKNNTMEEHLANEEKDGRDTNSVIDKVLGRHFTNETTEEKYKTYLTSIGLETLDNNRTYWRVKNERGKNLDLEL